jgi:Arc/MetJ-type ribon-helix-helix transcriptional regulator
MLEYMTFSIHLDEPTAEALARAVQETGRTRNALIREAVRQWLASADHAEWPDVVRHFKGDPKAVRFEEYRAGLCEPQDPFETPAPRRRRRT